LSWVIGNNGILLIVEKELYQSVREEWLEMRSSFRCLQVPPLMLLTLVVILPTTTTITTTTLSPTTTNIIRSLYWSVRTTP